MVNAIFSVSDTTHILLFQAEATGAVADQETAAAAVNQVRLSLLPRFATFYSYPPLTVNYPLSSL